MAKKPVLLVTRKLPDEVEARATRDYDAILNPTDEQMRELSLDGVPLTEWPGEMAGCVAVGWVPM